MKRVATITWINHYNFGTYLQAYALQQYIKSLGYDTNILDDGWVIPKKRISVTLRSMMKLVLSYIVPSRIHYRRSETQSIASFDLFKSKHLDIDVDSESLYRGEERYDVYVCGSDQTWNTRAIFNRNRDFYFAAFTKKKKVSYASSIGTAQELPKKIKQVFRARLRGFSFLSAREDAGCGLLSECTTVEVKRVVDPTLLLTRKQWSDILPSKEKQEKYVLGYFLTFNDVYLRSVKNYAQSKGLRLYLFNNHREIRKYADKLLNAGPIEFVDCIRNSECLFTDSFHGCAFSVVFEKQFVPFHRFEGGANSGQNARVNDLLSVLGIECRFLSESDVDKIATLPAIDYNNSKNTLNKMIEDSKEYLIQAIEN